MDLAKCPHDGTELRVLERRMAWGAPLLRCPACHRQFTLSRDGIVPAPGSGDAAQK